MSDKKREIPLSKPNLSMDIVDNLAECISTGWVSTGGRFISEFEEKMATYVNCKNAIACQSGTAGLHTALRILGVSEGDGVIVPTLTFIAAVNPVRYQGGIPFFMDCDDSLCLDTEKLEKFCIEECSMENGKLMHKDTDTHIKVIVPVHVFGNMCDMEKLMDIANRYGLKVLEDATEALGTYYTSGKYKGKYAGTIGDMGVYSFNANKIITTGGGGMIVTEDDDYAKESAYLTTTAKDDGLYFVHNEVGYNYRMLNLQAALGVSQIDQLESIIKTKIQNYQVYTQNLKDMDSIKILGFREDIRANYWFYSLLITDGSRDALMNELIKDGIQCRPVWKLVNTQLPYMDFVSYDIDKAVYYQNSILNVPCSSDLTKDDIKLVCDSVKRFYSYA